MSKFSFPLPRNKSQITDMFASQGNSDIHVEKLYQQMLFTDVTFIVDNTRFPAHRAVLSAVSEYYRALFTGPFKEGTQSELHISELDSVTFELFLAYVYGHDIMIRGWKQALAFLKFCRFTSVYVHLEEKFITDGYVPPEDYVEYVVGLNMIYEGEIPIEIIQKSAKYVTRMIDLSSFSYETIKIIWDSKDFGGTIPNEKL